MRGRRYTSSSPKRTLTPEQLQKMKEGRERAKQAREEEARQKDHVAKVSEMENQLNRNRREADSSRIMRMRRRKYRY